MVDGLGAGLPAGLVGFLIDELTRVLDSRAVRHGVLRLVAVNNNLAFSDGEYVFVKVSVLSGGEPLRREVRFLNEYGALVGAPALLVGEAVPVGGGKHYAVFYRFEVMSSVSYSMLAGADGAGLLAGVAGLLRRFHELPVREQVVPRLSFESTAVKVGERLQYFVDQYGGSLLAGEVRRYRTVFDCFVNGEWGAYVNECLSSGGVVCHGDSHVGNFVMRDGEICAVDFESVTVAPVEYDLVSLVLPLRFHYGESGADMTLLSLFDLGEPELLEGLLFMKLLSASSFLLLSGRREDHALFQERVEALESSYAAGRVVAYPLNL